MKNRITLDLNQSEKAAAVFKALASKERLEMIKLISEGSAVNISEMAEKFDLPISTTANHVKVLEEVGLIFIQEKPGLRGTQKSCAILVEDIYINIYRPAKGYKETQERTFEMPLGNFFNCVISKPCGMAGRHSIIGIEDSSSAFYSPDRIKAQLIWFSTGFLEYRFQNISFRDSPLREIGFSFEACSEAVGYNNDWPSDITLWTNDQELFTFRSAGDFGGKRGIYNPSWWSDDSTQYGELHHLEITESGCFGDNRKCSDFNIRSLGLAENDYISFKIGVKKDAEYAGGINLFGEHFGNYKQNLRMTVKTER
jgi:predicted transcriptional regulator